MPSLQFKAVTIRAGEALSDGVDCSGMRTIAMPAGWDSACVTFQLAPAGVNYADLYDFMGNEIQINVAPGTVVVIPELWARGIAFIKLRSGTRAAPRLQTVDRVFTVAVL